MKVTADRRRIAGERLEWWQQQVAAAAGRFAQAEELLAACEDGSWRETKLLEERKQALEEVYEARTEARRLYQLLCAWTRAEED
ncbi:MAG: hypothetical protein ABFD65_03090 [Candidatus Polarisedimenticolia bacterium]|jgi:hypothetical protein